jgi:hypothetical protein
MAVGCTLRRTGLDRIRFTGCRALVVWPCKSQEAGDSRSRIRRSRFLYYSKGIGKPGVWRVPIDGALEEPVIRAYPTGHCYRFWALVDDGIYYLNTEKRGTPFVDFLRFSTDRPERILELPRWPGPGGTASLAVSPNRRSLLTGFNDPPGSEILMVENFGDARPPETCQDTPCESGPPRTWV